jgi:hypothetical protein
MTDALLQMKHALGALGQAASGLRGPFNCTSASTFSGGRSELQTPPVRSIRNLFDDPDWGPRNPYSSLGISVRDHLFVQPFFLFPWEWGSSALTDLLTEISPKLPIKFRPNYFRRAVVNKRGDVFKFLRTAPKAT